MRNQWIAASFPATPDRPLLVTAFGRAGGLPWRQTIAGAQSELPQQEANVLMRELAHRSKNLLAVVYSLARQTLGHTRSKEEFEESFMSRLQGLAQSHDELVRNDWRGAEMRRLVLAQLAAFAGERVTLDGPELFVKPEAAPSSGPPVLPSSETPPAMPAASRAGLPARSSRPASSPQ